VALSDDEAATLTRLKNRLGMCRPDLDLLNAYYEGMQRLSRLGLAVPPALRQFVTMVNWPRVTVDAIEERLDLRGSAWRRRIARMTRWSGSGRRMTSMRRRSSPTWMPSCSVVAMRRWVAMRRTRRRR
jgi:hypothetical protein